MNATDHILIIGSGFAGLGMGIRLKQAGMNDFTILEAAPGIGGTWRDNHYPGAACDIQSHLYSFSFEPNPRWTRSFASQAEILEYLAHCADKYGLRPHLVLDTAVNRAVFDEQRKEWEVETTGGGLRRARALISGCGGLSRPSVPEIRGLARFEGKTFHSARWDHSYSLAGKRVGVVGTGASSIQIVPAIAEKVGKLHLFQRTAPWILPKPDRAIRPFHRTLFARAPLFQRLARAALYTQYEVRALGFVVEPALLRRFAEPEARKYLAARVSDPALRAKLTPDYRMGCKRVLMSNDYFEALQRDNAEVVTDGIEEIRAHGIVTRDGTERTLDALVLATGFHAADAVSPFEIRGVGGRDLNDDWRAGAHAYLGTSVSGFPNLFLLVGPNTGLGHNSMVFMIESQIAYVLDALKTMQRRGLVAIDVKREAEVRYNAEVQARMARTVWSTGGCRSWYTTKDGKNTTLWPGFTMEFRFRSRRFDPAPYHLTEGVRGPLRRGRAAHPQTGGGPTTRVDAG